MGRARAFPTNQFQRVSAGFSGAGAGAGANPAGFLLAYGSRLPKGNGGAVGCEATRELATVFEVQDLDPGPSKAAHGHSQGLIGSTSIKPPSPVPERGLFMHSSHPVRHFCIKLVTAKWFDWLAMAGKIFILGVRNHPTKAGMTMCRTIPPKLA
eukprot:gene13417-19270_t